MAVTVVDMIWLLTAYAYKSFKNVLFHTISIFIVYLSIDVVN